MTEEMERKFHSQIRVRVDKMSFPNAPDALIDVVNRMGLYRGSVVVVSFASSHHIDLAVNFILWAKAIGMKTLIGALDDEAFEILKKTVGDESHSGEGQAFAYRVDHHLEEQGSSHDRKRGRILQRCAFRMRRVYSSSDLTSSCPMRTSFG